MEQLTRVETEAAARERLTGRRRDESGASVGVLAELAQALEHATLKTAPQPPLVEQGVATETEKLRIHVKQLEGKLTSAEKASSEATAKPMTRDGGRRDEVRCFHYGGPHYKRDCPKARRQRGAPRPSVGPRGGCFKCGGDHYARDC